jgi:uncharacterized protein YjaG (DUF416 family)
VPERSIQLRINLLEFESQTLQFHTFLGALLCHFAYPNYVLACLFRQNPLLLCGA